MKSFEIEDHRALMNKIFVDSVFENFELFSISLRAKLDYEISGKQNRDYFDTDVLGDITEYIRWKDIKINILELLKGKRLPISMKLILRFSKDNITGLIEKNNLPISPEDVGALYYNVYLEEDKMAVTTGTSMNSFTMDKSLENLWDSVVEKYFI